MKSNENKNPPKSFAAVFSSGNPAPAYASCVVIYALYFLADFLNLLPALSVPVTVALFLHAAALGIWARGNLPNILKIGAFNFIFTVFIFADGYISLSMLAVRFITLHDPLSQIKFPMLISAV